MVIKFKCEETGGTIKVMDKAWISLLSIMPIRRMIGWKRIESYSLLFWRDRTFKPGTQLYRAGKVIRLESSDFSYGVWFTPWLALRNGYTDWR
jgi:hypothetical protein